MASGRHHEDLDRHATAEMPSDRSFGLTLAAILAFFAVLPWLRGGHIRIWMGLLAVVFLIGALVYSKMIHPITIAAMKFSVAASRITNPMMLALLYGLVFVPMGLWMRIAGRDPLRLKSQPGDSSYWLQRETSNIPQRSMLNQF